MVGINIGEAPRNSAVLLFYGAAALFFLLLSILMFIAADRFEDHFFKPQTLALVHAAALGWGTMIIFGAAYQLMPVIFEKKLFSSGLALTSFWFLLVGSIVLVSSFWFFRTGIFMISGGVLIFVAVVLYALNVFLTAGFRNLSIEKVFLIASAFWLLITVAIGILLAINLYYPYIPYNHLEILKLHAHIGFAGWFLQLITGVSSKLVPMFLFSKARKVKLIRAAFVFQNIGLAGYVTDHFLFGQTDRGFMYLLLVTIGVVCWLGFLLDVYIKRIKRKVDFQMRFVFISILSLIGALLLVPVILQFSGNEWSILYGVFIFLGWISGIIFGKTFKTLPFIIWNVHYKNVHGTGKIPLPKHLYNEKLLVYQFWVFLAALIILLVGIFLVDAGVIQIGLAGWIVVALMYNYNVIKVFLHKKQHNGIAD